MSFFCGLVLYKKKKNTGEMEIKFNNRCKLNKKNKCKYFRPNQNVNYLNFLQKIGLSKKPRCYKTGCCSKGYYYVGVPRIKTEYYKSQKTYCRKCLHSKGICGCY